MNKETIDLLRSYDDPNELARALLGSCAISFDDPAVIELGHRAARGDSEEAAIIRGLIPPSPKRFPRSFRQQQRAFERTRKFNKATWPPIPVVPDVRPEKEYGTQPPAIQSDWVPTKSDVQDLYVPWPTKSDHASYALPSYPDWDIEVYPPAPPRIWANPFQARPQSLRQPRSSLLTKAEVTKIFDGMSFSMREYGVTMSAHVIVVWSMMGIDETEGAKRLGQYLHEAAKWLRVGSKPRKRLRADPRAGVEPHFIWINENTPGRGFHSHILMNVPPSLRKDFDVWSRSCLVRHNGSHFPWKAYRQVRSYAKNRHDAVRRHWSWFRYLTKAMDPKITLVAKHPRNGVSAHLAKVIFNPWPLRHAALPVPKMKMSGVSHSLGAKAQRDAQFVSSLSRGQLNRLYDGDELEARELEILSRSLVI